VIFKWFGILMAWVFVNAVLTAIHLGLLVLATTGWLVWYAIHRIRLDARAAPLAGPVERPAETPSPVAYQWQFMVPPDWPAPPVGWSPPAGWQPDPSWPPAPHGWQFWVRIPPSVRGAIGERQSRAIPQDVKIAVVLRDQGMCVQCGSTEDLHFDHKIPWSKGGTNTVNNIQLLCGRCNRRKGASYNPG
jgi:hypothetical protein